MREARRSANRGVSTRRDCAGHHSLRHYFGIVYGAWRRQRVPGIVAAVSEAWCVHDCWIYIANMDVGKLSQFAPQCLGQSTQAEFARRISGGVGLGHPAAQRQRVDQNAAALCLEEGKGNVGPPQVTDQVGLDDLFVCLQWSVFEVADRANSGVVDPNIDSAMAKFGGLRRRA